MAVASQSGQSRRGESRGRTQAKRADSSTSRSRSTSRNGTGKASSTSKKATSRSGSTSKNGNNRSRSSSSSAQTSSARSNGQRSSNRNHDQHEALTNLGVSVFSAAVGVVGGVLLTRKTAKQHRKVLGVPVPDKVELGGVANQIGVAGRQFGQLAGEVRAVRQKAEQIGRLLS